MVTLADGFPVAQSLSELPADESGRPSSKLDLEPALLSTPAMLAAAYRQAFESGPSLTLGVEDELLLLKPETLVPVNEVEKVLEILDGDPRFACEFRAAQLELITPAVARVPDARRELAAARAFASQRVNGTVRFAAVGTHPLSTEPVVITPGDRYARMAAEYPWATWRGLPSGLHVHVAVRDSERALAVFNAARSYLPEIGALAANSPFYEGRDSGLASVRMKLNEDLPRSGIPPSFESWDSLAEYLAWGALGGAIPDPSHVWWDLRPNLRFGTIEFRVADAQTQIADAGAVAALCQALVAALAARYDACGKLPVHDTLRIAENRLSALRYGIHGRLVDLDTGIPVPTAAKIESIVTEVEPFAEQLGCRTDLLHAMSMLRENGADRQRAIAEREGLSALPEWLADQTSTTLRPRPAHVYSAYPHRIRAGNRIILPTPIPQILTKATAWARLRRRATSTMNEPATSLLPGISPDSVFMREQADPVP
jgi:carboxylate-amine ligase